MRPSGACSPKRVGVARFARALTPLAQGGEVYSPIWTPDGQRLVFNWLNDPRDLGVGCAPIRCYDVAPDGQRFYVVQTRTPPPLLPVTHIDLIQNWLEELKAKVPTGR